MLMKQKTVRFYEKSKADMEAYEKLECFREFGFNNARELIIAAVNAYSQKENTSSGMNIDIDRLADCIVTKIKKEGVLTSTIDDEIELVTESANIDIFDKALSFMESL